MKKTIIGLSLSVIILAPLFAFAQSTAEIQIKIEALLAQIKELQARLDALQNTQTQWCHTFNVNLKIGDRGSDVLALKAAFDKESLEPGPLYEIPPSLQGIAIEDDEFGYGLASQVDVFQEKYRSEILTPLGLARGTGYVGPSTRKKLNQLYGCGIKSQPIACTQEAKQCPDGSYVSRTGPKCEFAACPVSTNTTIKVLSPNGGERFEVGKSYLIQYAIKNPSNRKIYAYIQKDGKVYGIPMTSPDISKANSVVWDNTKMILYDGMPFQPKLGSGYKLFIGILKDNWNESYDPSPDQFLSRYAAYDTSDAPFSVVAQ